MKTLFKILLVFAGLGALGFGLYQPVSAYMAERNKPKYRTAAVQRGDIVAEVDSTGDVQPILSIIVGAVVSGPIDELNVDFNDRVTKGQLMAKIDTRLYDAAVSRDNATLETAKAEVKRAEATLEQSKRDLARAMALRERNKDYISQAEIDQINYNTIALEAQVTVANAAVKQAQANLQNSRTNLEYTRIEAPADGIVIHKYIDEGQTLASQFQTPELFTVAVELDQTVHVHALVDETEIGLVQKAKDAGRPAYFTVDAHPEDLFEGKIEQIRMSSSETQSVVTYPVIISSPNTELKLLPGMTAKISFEVDDVKDVIKVPKSALRFYPAQREHVREQDRKLLDGSLYTSNSEESDDDDETTLSARQKVEAQKKRRTRHVWVQEGDLLRAIEVTTGLADNRFAELESGDLKVGQELVIGLKIGP